MTIKRRRPRLDWSTDRRRRDGLTVVTALFAETSTIFRLCVCDRPSEPVHWMVCDDAARVFPLAKGDAPTRAAAKTKAAAAMGRLVSAHERLSWGRRRWR